MMAGNHTYRRRGAVGNGDGAWGPRRLAERRRRGASVARRRRCGLLLWWWAAVVGVWAPMLMLVPAVVAVVLGLGRLHRCCCARCVSCGSLVLCRAQGGRSAAHRHLLSHQRICVTAAEGVVMGLLIVRDCCVRSNGVPSHALVGKR